MNKKTEQSIIDPEAAMNHDRARHNCAFIDELENEQAETSAALAPGEEAVRSRAGSGVRVALICAVWAAALWAGSIVAFGDLFTPDFCGFLPGLAVFLAGLVQLVALSVLLWTVGRRRRMACWAGLVVAATVVLFAANRFYATSRIVDPLYYDRSTAFEMSARERSAGFNFAADIDSYRPFTGSEVPRLGEPSTLNFAEGDELPRVDSSSALLPLASAFVTATYPQGDVTVQWDDPEGADPNAVFQYNNSSEGFTMLAVGRTDVFLGTKSDAAQEEMARRRGVEFAYTPIGREGFVFLVNADNPVDSLTLDEVRGIYSGRITNWREVGGADAPIRAYQRNADSGSQSMMERFMEGDQLERAPEFVSNTMSGLVQEVADYDNGIDAIGYSFRYYATDLVGDYPVKLLAIEGIEPTAENVASEAYPITGEFYAVTRAGDESANLRALIEWMRGPQGQELVAKAGYAPLAGSAE